MPLFTPAPSLATAVGLATGAMHVDEPGGREKLTELAHALDGVELGAAAIVLARLLALHCSDDHLQELGSGALAGGIWVL